MFVLLLGSALALALAVYAAVLAAVWFGQEKLLFHPEPLPAEHRFALGDDVHEGWLDVPGARLNTLHLQLPHPDGVVFFLHGNSGNLDSWFIQPGFYRALNLDLFMFDYRGFGKSSGRITSQAELMADVRAAWDSIAPRYAGQRRIVYGRSLGTALAAMLAADVNPDLTVLVSPYTSMQAMAELHYPWAPAALLRYPLRTDEALAHVHGAVLLAHGGVDDLIPPENSRRLKAIAPQAQLLVVEGAGHGDIHEFPQYLDALRKAYAITPSPPSQSPGLPVRRDAVRRHAIASSRPRRARAPSEARCRAPARHRVLTWSRRSCLRRHQGRG